MGSLQWAARATVVFVLGCGSSIEPTVDDAGPGSGADAGPLGGTDAGPGGTDAGPGSDANVPREDAGPLVIPTSFVLGPQWGSPWEFEGDIGLAAGEAACRAEGADHVCDYEELRALSDLDALTAVADETQIWVHRTTVATIDGTTYEASEAARCAEWTYGSGHSRNGEFATAAGGALVFDLDETPVVGDTTGAGPCGAMRFVPCCSAD
jgi:hypothetical protein